jgi:hypothetical protein
LYTVPNIIRVIKLRGMKWVGHEASMGEREMRKKLGRSRRRWKNNIIMDLTEILREGVDRMHLAQDREQWRILVNTVIEPSGFARSGEFLD